MCGIYGYIGKNAYANVFECLKKLEYRGCDSCGICFYENGLKINKTVGTLNYLKNEKTNATIAFGHTRWATNGVVNYDNAHPHVSFDDKLIIVHNGIISNAEDLKEELLKNNVIFKSTTDTEVIVNYVAYKSLSKNLVYPQ